MTLRQKRRRQAAIDAVVDLVRESGVDQLQMRDVAERSGVALGTLYRYFASKDHLVAVSFMTWASALEGQVERRQILETSEDEPPADRLSAVIRLGLRPFQRQPNFARMLIYVSASTDPFASESYLRLGSLIRRTLGQAIPEVEPDAREAVLQVIGSVWYHSVVEWVSGRITVAEVHQRLHRCCQLLLDPPALAAPTARQVATT